MISIEYIPITGNHAGRIFKPHKFKDGLYVVSKTRFIKDYRYVKTYEEIVKYLDSGYKLRVSDAVTKNSPCLVRKVSLIIKVL